MGSTISRCGRGGEGPANAEEAGGSGARRSSGGAGGPRVGGLAAELRRLRRTAARRLGGGAAVVERLGGGATAVEDDDGKQLGGDVPRGRRPTGGGRVEAPRGWDSRVYGHGELFYCPMCMELVPINLKSSFGPCGHAFCSSCVTMYVAAKQREDVARVKCPDCENGVPVFVTDHTEGNGDLPADGHGELFDCAICMETVPGTLKFSVSPCGHAFCRSCVAQYVAAKLDDKVARVACPHPGCEAGAVEPESCRGIIPPDLLDRWGFLLCELAVGANNRVYCAYRECSALLLADADADTKAIAEAECPHCHRLFCVRCAVPWHDGMGCKEFQKLGQDERGRNELLLRRLVGRKGWQRCPRCRMFVEKSEGCNYMKCRCGNSFCYRCASKLSAENHHCRKCKR